MADPVRAVIDAALAEDVGAGDLTTQAVVGAGALARARIVQRAPGVIACLDVAGEVFRTLDPEVDWQPLVETGWWTEGRDVATIEGSAAAILTGERVALNLLGRLSGVATLTARYVEAVEGTGVTILDTRKTTPGLRVLEKRAVAEGGGTNHRAGLYDAILIKENHAALAGGVAKAVALARDAVGGAGTPIVVECRDLDELGAALAAGAERVLLDNMDPGTLRDAVELAAGRARLEASGGITLENVREVAETGVDFISVGSLTHSAPALDLSLLLDGVDPAA